MIQICILIHKHTLNASLLLTQYILTKIYAKIHKIYISTYIHMPLYVWNQVSSWDKFLLENIIRSAATPEQATTQIYLQRESRKRASFFLPTLLDPDFSFLVQFFIFFSYCHYVSGNFISFLERDKCPYMNSIYKKVLNMYVCDK